MAFRRHHWRDKQSIRAALLRAARLCETVGRKGAEAGAVTERMRPIGTGKRSARHQKKMPPGLNLAADLRGQCQPLRWRQSIMAKDDRNRRQGSRKL